MAQKKRPERDNCHWTEEEDNTLLDMIGTSTYNSIGSKLKRSPQAVEHRLQDLGMSDKYMLTGMMSARELAQHLNRDVGYIISLIKDCGLPAKTNNMNYKDKKQIAYYFIEPERFWTWAEKHRDKFNFAQMEEGMILPEPDWLEAQKRIDYYKPVTRKRWSEKDEEKAVELLKSGHTRQQVADVFNRNVDSISWIITKYNLAKPKINWTEEQKKTIFDLMQSGVKAKDIGEQYGVNATTIRSLCQRYKKKVDSLVNIRG